MDDVVTSGWDVIYSLRVHAAPMPLPQLDRHAGLGSYDACFGLPRVGSLLQSPRGCIFSPSPSFHIHPLLPSFSPTHPPYAPLIPSSPPLTIAKSVPITPTPTVFVIPCSPLSLQSLPSYFPFQCSGSPPLPIRLRSMAYLTEP